MNKFNLERFLNGGDPKLLCMMCKRYNCKKQTCPGDDTEAYINSGGYNCPWFQSPSTPVSDDQAYDVMCDILVAYEEDPEEEDPEKKKSYLETRRCYMERVLLEIIKQHGYNKVAKIFEAQGFDLPF